MDKAHITVLVAARIWLQTRVGAVRNIMRRRMWIDVRYARYTTASRRPAQPSNLDYLSNTNPEPSESGNSHRGPSGRGWAELFAKRGSTTLALRQDERALSRCWFVSALVHGARMPEQDVDMSGFLFFSKRRAIRPRHAPRVKDVPITLRRGWWLALGVRILAPTLYCERAPVLRVARHPASFELHQIFKAALPQTQSLATTSSKCRKGCVLFASIRSISTHALFTRPSHTSRIKAAPKECIAPSLESASFRGRGVRGGGSH